MNVTFVFFFFSTSVNFKMSKYMTLSDGDGQTVVLSIGRDLHMSCSLEDGKATLLLEVSR